MGDTLTLGIIVASCMTFCFIICRQNLERKIESKENIRAKVNRRIKLYCCVLVVIIGFIHGGINWLITANGSDTLPNSTATLIGGLYSVVTAMYIIILNYLIERKQKTLFYLIIFWSFSIFAVVVGFMMPVGEETKWRCIGAFLSLVVASGVELIHWSVQQAYDIPTQGASVEEQTTLVEELANVVSDERR